MSTDEIRTNLTPKQVKHEIRILESASIFFQILILHIPVKVMCIVILKDSDSIV